MIFLVCWCYGKLLIKKIYFFILFLFLSLVSVSDKYHCLREIIAEIYHTLLNISLQYFMKSAIHLLINLQGFIYRPYIKALDHDTSTKLYFTIQEDNVPC